VTDSPILAGMQIHHNFIRPNMGLEGRTPAEAAGMTVEGENKWLTSKQLRPEIGRWVGCRLRRGSPSL